MSCTIRRVWLVELGAKGFGTTKIWADTLEALDAEIEAHLARLCEVREARARALLARIAGQQKRAYRDARSALKGGGVEGHAAWKQADECDEGR